MAPKPLIYLRIKPGLGGGLLANLANNPPPKPPKYFTNFSAAKCFMKESYQDIFQSEKKALNFLIEFFFQLFYS